MISKFAMWHQDRKAFMWQKHHIHIINSFFGPQETTASPRDSARASTKCLWVTHASSFSRFSRKHVQDACPKCQSIARGPAYCHFALIMAAIATRLQCGTMRHHVAWGYKLVTHLGIQSSSCSTNLRSSKML